MTAGNFILYLYSRVLGFFSVYSYYCNTISTSNTDFSDFDSRYIFLNNNFILIFLDICYFCCSVIIFFSQSTAVVIISVSITKYIYTVNINQN